MNLNDVPTELFVFVNFSNPITEHNFKFTKQFWSSMATCAATDPASFVPYFSGEKGVFPFLPNDNFNIPYSPFCLNSVSSYRVEYDAELFRLEVSKFSPSRLSAVYAFGDLDSCKKASAMYGWDMRTVRKFKLRLDDERLTNITRVAKVNMEIISLARYAYAVSMLQDETLDAIWKTYWSGGGEIELDLPDVAGKRNKCKSGIMWEYLIDGVLVAL